MKYLLLIPALLVLLLLIADGFFTARILRRSGDIDLLSPRKLLRELRT